MKRLFTFLATFSLFEWIGRHPATAGVLMLLGVGGGAAGIANLTTPTIVPQPSAYFNQNAVLGNTNNVLQLNAASAGAMEMPSANVLNSFAIIFDGMNDSYLGNTEQPFTGAALYSGAGQPSFAFQQTYGGQAGTQWFNNISPVGGTAVVATPGSNYNSGFFPFTATGGGCVREPAGVWDGGTTTVWFNDPGFGCATSPTVNVATIPNVGAQQTGVTATCAASPVSGQMLVTTSLSVSPGLSPGMTYNLSGFTTSGGTSINTTFTATSVTGSGPYTLIGTAAGTCPTISSTGAALSGTGAAITIPALTTTAFPAGGATGITTKAGQHYTMVLGEYGADSQFPGAQFISATDDTGNLLSGAPALVTDLNQGTANWTGYTTTTQPALHVTAPNNYSITGASFSGGTNSTVVFTVAATTGALGDPVFIAGSEFTVSGVSPSGYNQTYVTLSETGSGPYTITANPLSGVMGTLRAISNPGSFVSGGSLASVVMPGWQVFGVTPTGGGAVIAPYGTSSSSGAGGVGDYVLTANPASFTFTATGTSGATQITLNSTPATFLAQGQAISGAGIATGTVISSFVSGSGGSGSVYNINHALTGNLSTTTVTAAGTIGSNPGTGGTAYTIFSFPSYYYFNGPTTTPVGVGVSAKPQVNLGDLFGIIGNNANSVSGALRNGWGGALGNMADLWGVFPQTTGGAPSTTALASLAKKTTDIRQFATANSLTTNSLYRLNDSGIWGDSSNATITGYIDSASGTSGGTATLHVLTTVWGSLALSTGTQTGWLTGPGLAWAPTAPASIPLTTSAGSSYTVTFASGVTSANLGSSGSPVTFSVGRWKPATTSPPSIYNGYIDNAGGVPTLHMTSVFNTGGSVGWGASFTGSLGSAITGATVSGSTLTVSGPTTGSPVIGLGSTVNMPGSTPSTATVTSVGTAQGLNGTYTLSANCTASCPSGAVLLITGILPGPAQNLFVSGVTGTLLAGQFVTDGATGNIGQPLVIQSGSGPYWAVAPNYNPAFLNDPTMVSSLSAIVPGTYVQSVVSTQPGINVPVKTIAYQGACGIAGAVNGGLGCYTLSASPNASGLVGSSGSPVELVATSIQDGGAITPGPALTIRDQGPGVMFPVTSTISCSAFGSCTGTATVALSGTFDTSVLGGTPSTIQAQFSLSPGGAPISGCSACAWTNLSSYSTTLSSGSVYNWSGNAISIPGGGPIYVSVRAANGTAYATMPNYIKVGTLTDGTGQGQWGAFASAQSGTNLGYFSGLWGLIRGGYITPTLNEQFLIGPPIAGGIVPGLGLITAGDRFGVTGYGVPLSEAAGTFEQLLGNAFGWPAGYVDWSHDGVGSLIWTIGGAIQTQTVGVGNGSATTWCSASKFCSESSTVNQYPLTFSGAALTGALFNGSVATSGGISTLTVGAGSNMISGALMPGMTLSGAGITGSPTLVNCTLNCGSSTAINGPSSQWTLSANLGAISSESMRADYGATPWPNFNLQANGGGTLPFNLAGFGSELVKAGTFTLSVNGTVVCQDSNTFAYNQTGGNCTGAGISSSFVNYQTGDYEVTFSSAPTGPITASWTNIISPEPVLNQFTRAQGLDYFGDGTSQSGYLSGLFYKTPSGDSGHINSSCSTDEGYILQGQSIVNQGYQFGAPGYGTEMSWLYGTKFATVPGMSAATPQITFGQFRDEGPVFFNSQNNGGKLNICDQYFQDFATKSTFSGSISSGVLTLSANAVGPMWEGEVIGGAGLTSPTGIYITSLASGAWGASGSTYNLSGASGVTASGAMYNDVYYKGSGPAIYGGAAYDIIVQNQGLSGTIGNNPHMASGFTGGRRVAARLAATIWGGLTNPSNASPPSLSRANDSAAGTPSPAFDYTNTYAATFSTATWSGTTVTISGGLAAHARPFVVGQAVSCSGCNTGLFITGIDAPPTQSNVSGAGQVGNTFHITVNSTIGGSGSGAITAGCTTGSGGSNCINFDFSINTTNGTFGTAAALATCGANNINGNAPNYQPPAGKCQDNGVGELTRGFRIGTTQLMYIYPFPTGSVFDDGADFEGGGFNRSSAFTCNIVAAKVVQCVKGPAYTSGAPSSIGKWTSGSTWANYGDMSLLSGRIASALGTVGAQSFPIANAGSSYTNGFYQSVQATCPTVQSGGLAPYFDITVSGGQIVNVYPSAVSAGSSTQAPGLGVGSACTLTNTNFPSGMTSGGGSGGSISIPLAPVEGVGGIATFNTDENTMGMFLYDNSGEPGNPLNPFFTNGSGGYFEPGLPLRPFGEFQGVAVSG